MHERLAQMLYLFYAFIALPGGFGTLEEIFHIATWAQLNIQKKPIGLLNVNNFYNGMSSFLDHAVEQKFIPQSMRHILLSASSAEKLIDKLQGFVHEPDPIAAQID